MEIYKFKTSEDINWQYICCQSLIDLATTLYNCSLDAIEVILVTDNCWMGEAK